MIAKFMTAAGVQANVGRLYVGDRKSVNLSLVFKRM